MSGSSAEKELLTKKQLAERLETTVQAVRDLIRRHDVPTEGEWQQPGPGKASHLHDFDLVKRLYENRSRQSTRGARIKAELDAERNGSAPAAPSPPPDNGTPVDISQLSGIPLKDAIDREALRKSKRENDLNEGILGPIADFAACLASIAAIVRNELDILPGRHATTFAAEDDPTEIEAALQSDVDRIMAEVEQLIAEFGKPKPVVKRGPGRKPKKVA